MFASTELIKNDPLRISVAVIGTLVPAVGIFVSGALMRTSSDTAKKVQGRPQSWFFSFAWSIIVIIFALVAIVCAFSMKSKSSLIATLVLIVLFTLVAIMWLYFYNEKNNKSAGAQTLGVTIILTLWLLFTSATSTYTDDDDDENVVRSKTFVSTLLCVPVTWCIYALLLNMFDANMIYDQTKQNPTNQPAEPRSHNLPINS
jgi:tryptophan-rich sensory protein